jgi:hypothetical protein
LITQRVKMPPRKGKKARQTRLTFEATGEATSPDRRLAPAKVRYTESRVGGAKTRPSLPNYYSSPGSSPVQKADKGKKVQQRLKDSLRVTVAPSVAFMPKAKGKIKRVVGDDDSSDDLPEIDVVHAAESESGSESDSEDELALPTLPKSSQSVSTRLQRTVIEDEGEDEGEDEDESHVGPAAPAKTDPSDEDDSDDVPLPSRGRKPERSAVIELDQDDDDEEDELPVPSLARRRRRPATINLDEEEEGKEDDIRQPASTSRRRRFTVVDIDDSDNSDISPAKKRKVAQASSDAVEPTPSGRLTRRGLMEASSPTKRRAHRSEKEKKRELLSRRRAGERIDKLTSSEDEEDDQHGPPRGLYDSHDEDGFQVLEEFDDEEASPEEVPAHTPTLLKKKKNKSLKKAKSQAKISIPDDSDTDPSHAEDEDLDDFIDEDDGPIGVPADLLPLEFTAQARAPLKDQFPYVVEWLVQNKINPTFNRTDDLYINAWRKLDDEVLGLARSKFTSSAWKLDFYRALRSRPHLEAFEMGTRPGLAELYESCEACGRSGHPATWTLVFDGKPYHKNTLVDLESDDSDDPDSDDDPDNDRASVDTQGNRLPSTSRKWYVGSTCYSNAETAHSLIHWKHSLKEW